MQTLLLTFQQQPKTGAEIRDAVLDDLERRNREWLEKARKFAAECALRHGEVSINDVREGQPPPPDVHPNVLGAVFRTKDFKQIGWTTAAHPGAHARAIRMYTLAWMKEY